jgi:hypothetical protein
MKLFTRIVSNKFFVFCRRWLRRRRCATGGDLSTSPGLRRGIEVARLAILNQTLEVAPGIKRQAARNKIPGTRELHRSHAAS